MTLGSQFKNFVAYIIGYMNIYEQACTYGRGPKYVIVFSSYIH